MPHSEPNIQRDDSGAVVQASNQDQIQGPLGIWPFPILNAILSDSGNKVEITEINRNEDGRIESIEEIKL